MLTAAVVLHKTPKSQIEGLLESVLPSAVERFFIIDNSPDDRWRSLEKCSQKIHYVHSENLGYGGSHNIAIQLALEAGATYHIALNPDIRFERDVPQKLATFMDEHTDAVYVLPKVIYPSGDVQFLCKLLPTPSDVIFRRFVPSVGVLKSWKKKRDAHYCLKTSGYNKTINPPCLSGCFMFFRLDALKANDIFFDEQFFLYFEDFDLIRRLHRVGKTLFYPDVCVIHDHAAQSYKSKTMLLCHIKSAFKYFNKYGWLFDKERRQMNDQILKEISAPALSSQKRVLLHISKCYFPELGGIEVTAQSLAEGLNEFENIVVCFATNGNHSEESINGIKLYRIASNFSFMRQRVSFSYFTRLKRIYEQHKPCAILVHCPNPFVYPFVMQVAHPDDKIILLWHSDILAKGLAYKLVRPFEMKMLKRANLVLATSPNYVEDSLISKYKSKIQILPSGINVPAFIKQDGDDERISKIKSEYSGKKIVFFCGRHVAYKGIDCLIRAERFVKSDCVFLIGGSGPLTKSLKKQVKSSQRIKFLGRLSTDELRCHLYAADVFAFPSVTKAEAFGLALAEAMFCGCPPVCFEIKGSGVNWVSVKGETGEEVPLKDIEKYAAAIDKVLSDNALRERYSAAARERVRKYFTADTSIEQAKSIFSSILQ